MPELESFTVALKTPFGEIRGNWKPDKKEREAAWEMYVELVTRISVVELKPDEGLLREALSSLYTLFDTTRGILRKYGTAVAKPKRGGDMSFGRIAVRVLNEIIRPVLAKWHPLLLDYEKKKSDSVSLLEHEKRWDKYEELRKVIEDARVVLKEYSDTLAKVAKIPPLISTD